jgi:hypothetical protein
MYKSTYICILALLFGNVGMAQLEGSHWFFGDSVILKFTEDSIFVTQAQLSSEEATSTISDKEGNLLFYTNSGYIYNKWHEPIHEEAIFGYTYDPQSGNISPEWSLLLPDPSNTDSLFYSLTMANTLSYTKIDLRLNDGNGGLVDTAINVEIGDTVIPLDTKLTSVRHGNGRDWWIFMRSHYSADVQFFIRWLLTPAGFSAPVYLLLDDWIEEENGQFGNMFFSQSGDRLVVIERTGFEVYEFDRCTGELDQIAIILEDYVNNFYYAALSGSGNKLYVSYAYSAEGALDPETGIIQYDLELLPDMDEVIASSQIIFQEIDINFGVKALKYEYITNKIYFAMVLNDSVYLNNLYLHSITEPELIGVACNVQENYLQLASEPGGMRTRSGLPNMPNYALGALQGSPCDTLDTANSVIEDLQSDFQVYPNPVYEYININNPFTTACETVVYNVTGQEVARLVLTSGVQTLNAQNWPNGIYQLVIQKQNEIVWRQTLVKSD